LNSGDGRIGVIALVRGQQSPQRLQVWIVKRHHLELGVDLSRFATELLFLTTRDKPILALPEHLLGSSSQMPQKANPFLLELQRQVLHSGDFEKRCGFASARFQVVPDKVGTTSSGTGWRGSTRDIVLLLD
jgi:hypothetical protein